MRASDREVVSRPHTFPDSYWSNVDRRGPGECWPWIGRCVKGGYGRVFVGYSHERKTIMQLAHRVAWELDHGESIPANMLIRHKCDNPPCQNPAHLELGTHLENMQDRTDRGRHNPARGAVHGAAKLTEGDVRNIRRMSANGRSTASMARQFGVSEFCIYAVVARKTWRHLQ